MRPEAEPTPDAADGRALPGRRRRRRRGTRLAGLIAAVLAAVFLLLGAGGWFYAGEIRKGALDPAPPGEPGYRIPVLAVGTGTVTLARDASSPTDLTIEGTWGVQWPDGYGQLGAIRRLDPGRVVRAFTQLRGSPLRVGDRVGIDGFAFPSDPQAAFGMAYQDVTYPSELGPTPAWRIQGSRPTWVLFVHGYNAPQREALRLLAPW